ncbi:MAG: hypothetical protein ABIP97_09565 [Chthoniobacterales bacterium]
MRNFKPNSSYGYFPGIGVFALLVLVAFATYSYGQEGTRPSQAGSVAFHHLLQEVAGPSSGNDRYNFRIGQSEWYLAARFSTEYNSNINLSQTNAIPDIIFRPALDMRVFWKMTKRNYLAAKFSVEYDQYMSNPSYNQFQLGVDPDTIFEFNMFIHNDIKIRFYEQPSTQRSAANNSTLANVQSYSIFNNIAGVSVLWDLNRVTLQAGIERSDQLSMNSNFQGLNSYTYTGYLTASVMLNPTLFVGGRLSQGITTYDSSVLNNNQNTTAGLFAQGQLSRYTAFRIEGGLQVLTFSDSGLPPDNTTPVNFNPNGQTNVTQNFGGGNFVGPYLTWNIGNRLNKYFTQGLDASLQATPGTSSNYAYIAGLNYNLSWRMNKKVNVSFNTFFQYGIQSGDSEDTGTYEQYGAKLRFDYFLVKYLNIFTEFGVIVRASELDQQSYNQLRAILGLQYAF